jgi:trimethylamine--corrinoid protein Co-methyltransferase
MNKTGIIQPGKPWKVLNNEQVKIIDNAAFEILREVGVYIDDEEMLKMAQKMGGTVDFEKKIVKDIPEHVIRESVAKAPKNFVFAGRNPDWDMVFEGGGRKQFWGVSSGATDRLNLNADKTFFRRRANVKDVIYAAKIIDGIDDFDWDGYLFDTAEEGQLGLPSELIRMNGMLQNTEKWAGSLCTTVSDIREFDYVNWVGAAVSGGEEELRKRPLFFSVYNLIGTLQMNKFNSWSLRASIKHSYPIHPAVTSAAPLMAPATAAGNVAVSHAGKIFMTAVKQYYNPGIAVTPNNIVFALDPFTGKGSLGSSHSVWGAAVMNQIYHDIYGLPTVQYHGCYAGSFDFQSTIMAMSTMQEIAIGTDMMQLQFGTEVLDPATIPMIAELAHYGKHLMSTFDQIIPTKENLALELAKQIGPMGQEWMTSDFNMSKIDSYYKTLSMETRAIDTWLKDGAPSWEDLCREKLKEYEKHEPIPLPKDVADRMDAIVKEGTDLLKRK